ncbi:nSTAND3 domain-containing NTPase [Pedobacter roseus]|uniref:AAA+ ATPase domain-containing protein n=1 Tax=Pedobacter roseus TaxID=336820 RepID=A0A7G9QGZ0_9SPHI|nr:restriction endonuclease [Pedobacter roseus]QNN42615.1 hypothetical protein H9L23_00405 [Pedobacter roseus]
MKYNLEVLHNKDFEELAKDLLEADLPWIKLQSFRSGRDKGIDLRYAGDHENELIVQAKHYLRSKFADLKRQMKLEKKKIDALNPRPKRYILFTSFDLGVEQTDELVQMFQPYLKNSQDIYGLGRIESLIASHPKIEKRHYKLWLTSSSVLEHILHNGVSGRSEFVASKILMRSKLYVPTQNLDRAVSKLNENKVLIITGEPGVGKTTIAYQLLYNLLAEGFELVNIDGRIDDAEDLLFLHPEKKQVAFFDDFLGANIAEILNPRNSQNHLVNFVERVRDTKNKLLILTTRTTILNQANQHYYKFKRIGTEDELRYSVVIKDYSKLDKARILYNHIYHLLPSDNQEVFFEDNYYKNIVSHENFFPRLIEFITTASYLKGRNVVSARAFIQKSLDHPSEIWEHAYREQLNPEDQFLITTLFSFGKNYLEIDALRTAFNARYDYEIKHNGFMRKTDAFGISLSNLGDGFISTYIDKNDTSVSISLLNPSIADFLLNYLQERPDELRRLFFSATYLDQITFYFGERTQSLRIPAAETGHYFKRFIEISAQLKLLAADRLSLPMQLVYVHLHLFKENTSADTLLELLGQVQFSDFAISDNRYYLILNELEEFPEVQRYISENWFDFLVLAINVASDSTRMNVYFSHFKALGIDELIWSENPEFLDELLYVLNREFGHLIDDFDYSSVRENAFFWDEDSSPEYDENDVVNVIEREFDNFLDEYELSHYKDLFWERIDFDASRVLTRQVENWNDYSDYSNDYARESLTQSREQISPDSEIDRLFER